MFRNWDVDTHVILNVSCFNFDGRTARDVCTFLGTKESADDITPGFVRLLLIS